MREGLSSLVSNTGIFNPVGRVERRLGANSAFENKKKV